MCLPAILGNKFKLEGAMVAMVDQVVKRHQRRAGGWNGVGLGS